MRWNQVGEGNPRLHACVVAGGGGLLLAAQKAGDRSKMAFAEKVTYHENMSEVAADKGKGTPVPQPLFLLPPATSPPRRHGHQHANNGWRIIGELFSAWQAQNIRTTVAEDASQ